MINVEKVKKEERDSNGSLNKEGRYRITEDIKKIILHYGSVNYTKISYLLGIRRETAKKLVKEVIDEWKEEFNDRVIVQAKFFENIATERLDHPEVFTEEKKIEISEVASLLNRANFFSGMINNKLSKQEEEDLFSFIKAWSTIGSRTKKILEEKREEGFNNNNEREPNSGQNSIESTSI